MVNLNFSFIESFGSAPNAAANFFSSLNAAFGGGSTGAGLFNRMLTETSADAPSANANLVSTPSNVPMNNPVLDNGANTGFLSSLQDVVSAWSGFVQKWQSYQNGHSGHQNGSSQTAGTGNDKASTTSPSGVGSNVTPVVQTANTDQSNAPPPTAPAGKAPNNTPNNASSSGASASMDASTPSDTTVTRDPPTLADLLTELQAMLQLLQQQIQYAKLGNTTTVTNAQNTAILTLDAAGTSNPPTPSAATTSAATPATGTAFASTPSTAQKDPSLLVAADMMIEILQLSQFAEKRLGLTPDASNPVTNVQSPDPATTAASSATTPDLTSFDTQLRTNLKALLDALQAGIAANGNEANSITPNQMATANTSPQINTDAALTDLVTTPATASPNPMSPPDIISNALSLANDFVKQLSNLFAASTNTTPTAFVPPAGVSAFSAASGGNPSFNSFMTDDGGNATANSASSSPINTTPLTASDGAKQSDPYSFASQLSATRAANGGTTGLPSAIEQVMFQLSRNVKSGNDQMTLQLSPADLGQINIKLDFTSDGKVQGTIMANNPVTLDMLQKDVRSLERALQDAGLSADPGSLQFSLGGQSGNTRGQMAENSSSDTASSNDNADVTNAAIGSDTDTTDQTETWYITPGRVNMKV